MAAIASAGNGPFSIGETWVGGVAPTWGDDALIGAHTIDLDGANGCDTVIISAGGTLDPLNVGHSLECRGNFDPSAGTITNGHTNNWTLIMNAVGAILTPGTNSWLWKHITISNTTTFSDSVRTSMRSYGTTTINATLTLGTTMSWYVTTTGIDAFTNNSTVTGGGNIRWFMAGAGNRTIPAPGNISCSYHQFQGDVSIIANVTVSLLGALTGTAELRAVSNDAVFTIACVMNGNNITCGDVLFATRSVFTPGNTDQILECSGDGDFSAGTITNGGTDNWELKTTGTCALDTTGDQLFKLNVFSGTTTLANATVTNEKVTIASGATLITNGNQFTHGDMEIGTTGTITVGTDTLVAAGTGTNDTVDINPADVDFYDWTFNDSYTIFGDGDVNIVHGGTLTNAAGKTLTIGSGSDGFTLTLIDSAIANLTNNNIITSGGTNGALWFEIAAQDINRVLGSAGAIGTLTNCNLGFNCTADITANRIIDPATANFQCVALDITCDDGTYKCIVHLGDNDITTSGVTTIGTRGRLENPAGAAAVAATWTFNDNVVVNGEFFLDGNGHGPTIVIADAKSFTGTAGLVDIQGSGAPIAFGWANYNIGNQMTFVGAFTITLEDVDISKTVSLKFQGGGAVIDFQDVTTVGGSMGVLFDSTPTSVDIGKTTGCNFAGSSYQLSWNCAGALLDSIHNTTFNGVQDVTVWTNANNVIELIDCTLTHDTCNINTAAGGLILDNTATNVIRVWGVVAVSDFTQAGTVGAGAVVATIHDDDNGTNHASFTVDDSFYPGGGCTIETNSSIIHTQDEFLLNGIVTNNGSFIITGATSSMRFRSLNVTPVVWVGNAPTFSAFTGTYKLGYGSVTKAGWDLKTNALALTTPGTGGTLIVEYDTDWHTITLAADTIETENNGAAQTCDANAITIENGGTLTIGKGTITGVHTWNMANGADITIEAGGDFNIGGASAGTDVNIDWAVAGEIKNHGTITWDYADINVVDMVRFYSGCTVDIDHSNIAATGAYGIYCTNASTTITKIDNTTVSSGVTTYALAVSANGVTWTDCIHDCTFQGVTADVYFNSVGGILELINCDGGGAAGRLEIIVPAGGISDDVTRAIRINGDITVSDLGNYSNWAVTDYIDVRDDVAGNHATFTVDVNCNCQKFYIRASCVVSVSATIVMASGAQTENYAGGTFRCLDGMVFGSTAGAHKWNGVAPYVGYDHLNTPTVEFKFMDFAINSITVDTVHAGVILVTSGNIAWHILDVQLGDEWHHLDAATTITWTVGQTSTIAGTAKVQGTTGNEITWTGANHLFNLTGATDFRYLTVTDSDASGGDTVYAFDSTGTGTTNWWFSGDTNWYGMTPYQIEEPGGANTITPLFTRSVSFALGLNTKEYKFQARAKPTTDQNIVEVRGRKNIQCSLSAYDLTAGATDLAQLEAWFRAGTRLDIIDKWQVGSPLSFYYYSPYGWRIMSLNRNVRAGDDVIEYSLTLEEVAS